jgi:hypothetical protein
MTIGAFHALVIARRGCSSSFGAFVFLNEIDGAGECDRRQELHERATLGRRERLDCGAGRLLRHQLMTQSVRAGGV